MFSQSHRGPRRAVRRAISTVGQAVELSRFQLLGERIVDVSPAGLLLACDGPAQVGESLLVSFEAPGSEPFYVDAEAEVARVVHGFRAGDPGYCAGLRFTYLERSVRRELLTRLAGYPPPIPRPRRPVHPIRREPAVVIRPVLNLGEVTIPLTRRRYPVPRGAFGA